MESILKITPTVFIINHLSLILTGYFKGSVIAQYLSRDITQRFRIEAVDARTSAQTNK